MSLADRDRIRRLERMAAEAHMQLARLPVRDGRAKAGGGDSSTMLLVTINQNVAPGQNVTVDQEYYSVVFGAENRDTIEVVNRYNQTFAPGEYLPCWKREADGLYEPDRSGEGSESTLVHFELAEDLSLADGAALAYEVDASGVADPAAQIYVLDPNAQFVGRAAYSDPLGEHLGYRGFAELAIGEYTQGRAGYRIITMEGSMRDIAVQLAADQNDAVADTPVAPLSQTVYGNPFHGRFPPADSATGQFTATDPYGVAAGAKLGDKFLVKFSGEDNGYHFAVRLEAAGYHRARGKISGTITRGMATATLTDCEAVDGRKPPTDITATIPDYAPLDVPASYTGWIYVRWNERVGTDEASHWDTADLQNLDFALRGKADFDSTKYQVLITDGPDEADRKWVEAEDQTIFLADPAPTVTLSNPTSTSLRVKIDGQQRSVKVIPNAAATALSVQGDLAGEAC